MSDRTLQLPQHAAQSHLHTYTHITHTPWSAYVVEKLLPLFIAWLAVASSVCAVYAHCLWAIITKWFTIAESANKRWIRLHIIVLGLPWCPARRVARCIMHWNHINHVATCTLRNCSHIEPEVKLPRHSRCSNTRRMSYLRITLHDS